MKKIAVYTEFDFKNNTLSEVSYELISKMFSLKERAKDLTSDLLYNYTIDAIVLANEIDDALANKIYSAGADRIVLIQCQEFETFNTVLYSKAFLEYYQMTYYDCIIFPATVKTRMVAPRITTALDTGLVADCTNIDFVLKDNELKLASTRPTFGSELMAVILSKKNPQCATVRAGVFKAEFNNSKQGELIKFCVNLKRDANIEILNSIINDKAKSYFDGAKIILAGGFGIAGNNSLYYKKLQKLADKINAKTASTRKVVDYNYMSFETQVGQTGQTVTPDIYIAFGVSGAIQHICGMKNSKKIVAINTDRNAEIFKYSDIKIVADAKEIIDKLLEKYPD